jgi:hypothetical protein
MKGTIRAILLDASGCYPAENGLQVLSSKIRIAKEAKMLIPRSTRLQYDIIKHIYNNLKLCHGRLEIQLYCPNLS